MKISIGNHLKMHVHKDLKPKVIEFYETILGCKRLTSSSPAGEVFIFEGNFFLGIAFLEKANILSEQDLLKAAWMELKTEDPEKLKERLQKFGVKEVDYHDKDHFYFQAPGGQVFRLNTLDG